MFPEPLPLEPLEPPLGAEPPPLLLLPPLGAETPLPLLLVEDGV